MPRGDIPSRHRLEEGTGMLGSTEILIIAAIVLVLFGSTAIPKFARSLGKARKEFEAGLRDSEREEEKKPERADDKKSVETGP